MNNKDFGQYIFPRLYDKDIYMEHRELASAEELEDWDFDERGTRFPTFPAEWNREKLKLSEAHMLIPDAMGRSEWEQRSPALGLSERSIRVIEQHMSNPSLRDVQRRHIFRYLRVRMLQQLICCSGAGTVHDLCKILRAELDCGVPAPAPAWYVFSTVTMGPRKVGYFPCSNRGCLVTESVKSAPFKKCSRCRVAWYCSEKCQASDWAARHSVVCNESTKNYLKMECAKACIQRITEGRLTDLPSTGSHSHGALLTALGSPEVAFGFFQLQSDLKKEKNRTSFTEVPTPHSRFGQRFDCVRAFKVAFTENIAGLNLDRTGDLASSGSNSLVTLDSADFASRSAQQRADPEKETKLRASDTGAPTPLSRYIPGSSASLNQRSLSDSVVFARNLVSGSNSNGNHCVITGSFSEASGRLRFPLVDSCKEKNIEEEDKQLHPVKAADSTEPVDGTCHIHAE